ncbi:CRISPR-associated protein Cas4 [bacterium]|nr:CRISPR-associated protein Cas4 [bacterium]
MFAEDELLPLSALQHYLYCERQCALIHLEGLWRENLYTAEGRVFHDRVHRGEREWREDVLIVRSLPLRSLQLGLAGVADVLEFHPPPGVHGLPNLDGGLPAGWTVHPIEYKRGRPKHNRCDEVQLCTQALCLEEMLSVKIAEGSLFYGRIKRRQVVCFDDPLRSLTVETAEGVRRMIESRRTPPAPNDKRCTNCSLKELCLPGLSSRRRDAEAYLKGLVEEE